MSAELSRLAEALPKMLVQEEFMRASAVLPDYDPGVIAADTTTRLMELSKIYQVYVPSRMSEEVYEKIYISLMRSLRKKGTKLAVIQQNENHKMILGMDSRGVIGGADSFTIIGDSGVGKSSAVDRAIQMITENRVIETTNPMSMIIPCLSVQCPFDCSAKSLLLRILENVDSVLGTSYFTYAIRARANTDMLIGTVSQVALNHIGMLIVDEIQNVVENKNGRNLVGLLTQLINSSGIAVCMVGTPECVVFFERAIQLARRSLGIRCGVMPYDDFFKEVCETLFSYQYVREREDLSEGLLSWTYEHTRGMIGVLVELIHDAQEIAILDGSDRLDQVSLETAYRERLTMMYSYLGAEKIASAGRKAGSGKRGKKEETKKEPEKATEEPAEKTVGSSITDLVQQAKRSNADVAKVLLQNELLEEVAV